jgi:small-conductance mechanosensitive channel
MRSLLAHTLRRLIAVVTWWPRQTLAALLLLGVLGHAAAQPASGDVPLVVGNRTVHVFRGALGDISAQERALAARAHIDQALAQGGEGWTSVIPSDTGLIVALDGKPMFAVSARDARPLASETPEFLANQASRALQKVWAESREHRGAQLNLPALAKTFSAVAMLVLGLALLFKVSRGVHRFITRRLAGRFERFAADELVSPFSGVLLKLTANTVTVAMWLLGLLAVFAVITFGLSQFAVTRAISENLSESLEHTVYGGLRSTAAALPGLFVAIMIFVLARIATQVTRAVFDQIVAGRLQLGALDAHTAPPTRYLVNAAIWLFALAMSYPYLPGSQTEAFKGLSVLLGVMVSIGAAGPIGQIASGMILVFTRALLVGEYVRIQDCEGTVTHLGLYVTRLRTGTGEEIALPNSLVISQVTRNFSRNVDRGGFVLDTCITIGYDAPWRQVHAMLLEAAQQIKVLRQEPAPFVVQTALSDFYVEYRLVVQVGAEAAANRPQVLSDLNAAVQDVFNRYGVQIMSPHYMADPETPVVVPPSKWFKAPAAPAPGQHQTTRD